ncbi:FAD-binding oxidoreductase [Conexibacter sp. DBS9H8]|uniref:FAD-binding oxidoreductase n=1 Tax=Conexibacter sp. DBS9H8 TaxID=2937801 RepID=UPI00200C0C37|nr:FAD-linked oxidase C-terminal domain-containing protein [Conexibacter sp. DBS9H8]
MTALADDLSRLLGAENVIAGDGPGAQAYLGDATESRGLHGAAEAIALPTSPAQVVALVAYAYAQDVPLTPRGAGTGFSGGAVPAGGIVIATERLTGVPRVDLDGWAIDTPAAATTAALRERAAQHGLHYPPDPGSQEVSLIGGNIATNAGGPHTFKYGVTGRWVETLDVVLAPGELVTLGAPVAKDVSSYDLRSLLIGSEGTLGIICGARLRLIPRPECRRPVLAAYPDTVTGVAAIHAVLASGIVPAALEYLDARATEDGRFTVLAEADGSSAAAAEQAAILTEAMAPGALTLRAPTEAAEIAALWRWRDGVSLTVTARRGGKVSEDIVISPAHLTEAIETIAEIGARHDLPACSWGHAADGNLHATFLIDRTDAEEIDRAEAAASELFDYALSLGGSLTGEHGIGTVKRAAVARALSPAVIALNAAVKATLDPKGLLNPGVKLP